MRRCLLAVLLVSVVSLALPSVAGAQTSQPTVVLEEYCVKNAEGAQIYGIRFGVTGFPPNVEFTWTLTFGQSGIGPATFTTDANGEWILSVGSYVPTL